MKASDKALQSEAKKMLKNGVTAPEFSAHFFGSAGKLASLCATSADRKQMVSSEIYRWLQQQLGVLRTQEAEAFNQETKALSGRVTSYTRIWCMAGKKR